ncbi:uncharacterized protein N7482_010608 [Penicillium canariense]|uniref:Uncharacterized protein n=1 Tax=Penicillium canariense TaxID=189055 RepID=A0A9W9LD41_9EURO|nr:uncharacterized protein N7482_010608 [Penicillium canariense]KAJ5151356.1 hypothetical protein N7482_010608 [Penicillium canariense]
MDSETYGDSDGNIGNGEKHNRFDRSMADLKKFLTKSMMEACKLDACMDLFLIELNVIRGSANGYPDPEGWYTGPELPESTQFENIHEERLNRAAVKLEKDINCLLPGFLDSKTAIGILHQKKVRGKLQERWKQLRGDLTLYSPDFGKQWLHDSHKSLLNAAVSKYQRQAEDTGQHSEPPKLSQLAFEKACRQLEESISGEKASATFACGGLLLQPVTSYASTLLHGCHNKEKLRATIYYLIPPPTTLSQWDF